MIENYSIDFFFVRYLTFDKWDCKFPINQFLELFFLTSYRLFLLNVVFLSKRVTVAKYLQRRRAGKNLAKKPVMYCLSNSREVHSTVCVLTRTMWSRVRIPMGHFFFLKYFSQYKSVYYQRDLMNYCHLFLQLRLTRYYANPKNKSFIHLLEGNNATFSNM